ncbi:DoxX family protein [Nocardiopsis baichengensis]|uniref:DoxX family protein n=1 Tax=Nocardiopsis baichengensis TaxID=280240 RepID=UPI000348A735|nr:DoxX family protein [Nocardiopsis baichengensis]
MGDVAVCALRVGLGATLFAHGAQKLFGWFGGGGLKGTAEGFHAMGYRPGGATALVAGASEAVGGAALVLGAGTPAGGAAVAGTMGVAAEMHAPNGFFNTEGGFEYPGLLGLAAVALIAGGPGRLSVDHATGHVFDRPWMRAAAIASVAPAVAVVVARKRKALAAEDGSAAEDEG